MGFQSSYSIPEFIDPHSTPKPPRGRYRPLWLPLFYVAITRGHNCSASMSIIIKIALCRVHHSILEKHN
ncbi:hypothetical protein T09_10258 [Trichinella sp. T9]|nr:hypothetical protein T09_10258 [Trichinella sp. T9]